MSKFDDLTGKRFNMLTVVKFVETGKPKAHWLCQCDCGNLKVILGASLKTGATKGCGCQIGKHSKEYLTTHNQSGTELYKIWTSMKQRCTNPNHVSWEYYGGRGITVSDEWFNSFEQFYIDMGPRPDGMQLDRIDNNAGYSKENCRWVTRSENQHNRRDNKT